MRTNGGAGSRKVSVLGVTGALAVNILGASCGLIGSPAPETPPGFTRTEAAGLSLAYPQQWRRFGQEGKSKDWQRVAGRKAAGQTVAQVAVNPASPDIDDPKTAVETGLASSFLNLPGFERVGHASQDVPAGRAYRVTYVYHLPQQGPEATQKKGYATDIGVTDDSGNTVVVRISGIRPHLGKRAVDRIASSVAVAE